MTKQRAASKIAAVDHHGKRGFMNSNRILLLTLGLLACSCDRTPTYTLATHHEATQLAEVGGYLAEAVSRQQSWRLKVLTGDAYNAAANVDLVASHKADFGITVNTVPAEQAIAELELKTRALRQMQQEKLAADESFTIFLDLVHHNIRNLEAKPGS